MHAFSVQHAFGLSTTPTDATAHAQVQKVVNSVAVVLQYYATVATEHVGCAL